MNELIDQRFGRIPLVVYDHRRHAFETLLGKAKFDCNVLARDRARFGQFFAERGGLVTRPIYLH